MRDEGYTGNNEKGDSLWEKLMRYTSKEYLMFTASDSQSCIEKHSFAVLKAIELSMDGENVRMLQMRNPWST